MAQRKAAVFPLQQEDRDELLKAVRRADQPLEASKFAKLAAMSRPAKGEEVVAILDEFVAAGVLQTFPPKTAKGKPRYWDRDPSAVARTRLLEIVETTDEPLSAKDAKQLLKLPFKFSDPEIDAILQECVREGRIHEVPAKSARSGPRYWNQDALAFARRSILELMDAKGPQAESGLKKVVKWLDDGERKRLLESLIVSRAIYRHPPLGSSTKTVFGTRPPSPGPYLKGVGKQLTKVVGKLREAEVPAVELRRAIVQIVESAGVPFTGPLATNERPAAAESAPQSQKPVDLAALMKQIEPGAERGALVTTRVLRRIANLSKAEFDSLALELARRGTVVLHRHDFPSSLTPQERDELVTDGRENYYVGLALRPVQGAR